MGETRGDLRMLAPEALLADRERFAHELLGDLVQLELLVDATHGVEQAGAGQRLVAEPGANLLGAAVEELARRDRVATRGSRIVHLEQVDQELDDLLRFRLRLAGGRRLAVGARASSVRAATPAASARITTPVASNGGAVAARELAEDIEAPRRSGENRFESAMALDVVRQLGRRVVAHLALACGRLESDPVQVAAQRP